MDESCRFKDNDAMSPKKEMQTHLGRETRRDSLWPSEPIHIPQLCRPASTRPMSKRAHGSADSENRIERRNFRMNPNAQRSSANVEIRSKISDPNGGQLHGPATIRKAGKNEMKAEKDESD